MYILNMEGGLYHMCATCRAIKTLHGEYHHLLDIRATEAIKLINNLRSDNIRVSHGICPRCADIQLRDITRVIMSRKEKINGTRKA